MKILQTLDNKSPCKNYYHEGAFCRSLPPHENFYTWRKFNPGDNLDLDFGWLYVRGDLSNIPSENKTLEEFLDSEKRMLAHYRALMTSAVSLEENCFFDLVPEPVLRRYFTCLNNLTKHVFMEIKRPDEYDILKKCHHVNTMAESYKLNINLSRAQKSLSYNDIKKIMLLKNKKVSYNIFGTKTGRFSCTPNSFPILNIKKEIRQCIEPNKDLFLVFDYNAAEARTLLALNGEVMPLGDVHEHNMSTLNLKDRDSAKKSFFSWLYDMRKKNKSLESIYNRESAIENFYDGTSIHTPFGRKIEVTKEKSLNYLLQSTLSDLVVESACKVINKYEHIQFAFTLHDSIVFDISASDKDLILSCKDDIENTSLANIKSNLYLGKDFLNLRQIK